MRRALFALATLAVLAATSTQPASAIDHGVFGVIGAKDKGNVKTHITKEFPPMAGVYGFEASPAQAFVFYNSYGCMTYSYCNRHELQIDVPDGYLESLKGTDIVSYGVKVTLTWADPKTNDLDLFVGWVVESESSGAPGGPCSTPADEECQKLYPESHSVIEPKPEDDETTEEDESKQDVRVFISVLNHTGVNTGYTLDAQWFLIPFGSFPEFEPPKDREVTRQITRSRTPAPYVPPAANATPDPSTKILIPGPDGKLVEQTLDFLSAGNRLTSEKSGTASWTWIATIVITVLAVAAFAYFVWQRRRREAQA